MHLVLPLGKEERTSVGKRKEGGKEKEERENLEGGCYTRKVKIPAAQNMHRARSL
jgi:hypothetical protein